MLDTKKIKEVSLPVKKVIKSQRGQERSKGLTKQKQIPINKMAASPYFTLHVNGITSPTKSQSSWIDKNIKIKQKTKNPQDPTKHHQTRDLPQLYEYT